MCARKPSRPSLQGTTKNRIVPTKVHRRMPPTYAALIALAVFMSITDQVPGRSSLSSLSMYPCVLFIKAGNDPDPFSVVLVDDSDRFQRFHADLSSWLSRYLASCARCSVLRIITHHIVCSARTARKFTAFGRHDVRRASRVADKLKSIENQGRGPQP